MRISLSDLSELSGWGRRRGAGGLYRSLIDIWFTGAIKIAAIEIAPEQNRAKPSTCLVAGSGRL